MMVYLPILTQPTLPCLLSRFIFSFALHFTACDCVIGRLVRTLQPFGEADCAIIFLSFSFGYDLRCV